MTGQAVRASRVRRCRYGHHCPLCHGQVLVGQPEGLVTGAGWCHTDCVMSAQRQAQG
jgi:hypothetical protein